MCRDTACSVHVKVSKILNFLLTQKSKFGNIFYIKKNNLIEIHKKSSANTINCTAFMLN